MCLATHRSFYERGHILENLTIDDFSNRIGETFRIRIADDQALDIALAEVNALGTGTGKRTPFSLMLRSSGPAYAPQGIYRIEHNQLGAFDLFIVPLGPDQQGMRYEVIFT